MQTFEKSIMNMYGEKGRKWIAEIPDITAKLAKKYNLTELKPVSNMSYNYVASGYLNEKPIILKLGLNAEALAKEEHCLQAFANFGVVNIFFSEEYALVIEQAIPGVTLKGYFPHREEESIEITSSLIKKLHHANIPLNHHVYHVRDLLQVLNNALNIPNKILIKARKIRDKLIASTKENVLLHGDLHHENILQNGDDWVVIDPKGFIGDPVYEAAAFIRNPIPELLAHENAKNIIHNRIFHFAEILEYPEQRIIDWCFVQAVLCWIWALEDNCDSFYFKELTEFFDRVTPM